MIILTTCEWRTPADKRLTRWKERQSPSNIQNLRQRTAPPNLTWNIMTITISVSEIAMNAILAADIA